MAPSQREVDDRSLEQNSGNPDFTAYVVAKMPSKSVKSYRLKNSPLTGVSRKLLPMMLVNPT